MTSASSNPLISVLTPSLNRGVFIEEAIQSVIKQGYERVEYIIIDGGSTDNTHEVVRRYPGVRLIVESDRGLYDAMNKGLRQAQGDIIGFINTDDAYEANIFAEVADLFTAHPDVDMLSGWVSIFEDDSNGQRRVLRRMKPGCGKAFTLKQFIQSEPLLNARFIRKRVYEKLGAFNCTYRIASDRDFVLRLALSRIRNMNLNHFIYHYRKHPGSLSMSDQGDRWKEPIAEDTKVARKYINRPSVLWQDRMYLRIWLTRTLWRGIHNAAKRGDLRSVLRGFADVMVYWFLWPPALLFYLASPRNSFSRTQQP